MVVARKIAYNVVVNVGAKVVSTILALTGIGFITRYLGKEGFGDYATVLAFFSFFGAIADLGLYSVATREISRENADEEKILGNVLTIRILSSLAVILISPLIIFFLPYNQDLKTGILLAAMAFIFSSGYLVLNGVFQKNLAMDRVALAEIAGKLAQVGIIILAVTNHWGFVAIVSSLLASMIVNFTLVFLLSRRFVHFKLHFNRDYIRSFLRESLPMGASVIITFLYFKLDTILLSFMKGSADVGIYNAAYKIIENITFFPGMIIGLVFPIMSRFIFSDRKRFEDIADKTWRVFVLLVLPLVTGALFLASDIIRLIGGVGFAESAAVLKILIFALAFIFLGNFFTNVLVAGNQQKKMMHVLAWSAGVNVLLNLVVIPRFSYIGAAITSVVTELMVAITTGVLTYKTLKYTPRLDNKLALLISTLAMGIFLFVFQNQNFFLVGVGSVTCYVAFLWLTKAVTPQELRSIFAKGEGIESPISL